MVYLAFFELKKINYYRKYILILKFSNLKQIIFYFHYKEIIFISKKLINAINKNVTHPLKIRIILYLSSFIL
jgi:hypothetical protein